MQITDLLTVRFIVTNNCMYSTHCLFIKNLRNITIAGDGLVTYLMAEPAVIWPPSLSPLPVISILEFFLAMLGFLGVMPCLVYRLPHS